MINSRKIEDLHPKLQELCRKHIDVCTKRGVKIIVTSTLRDQEYQSQLYAQGRTKPGQKVTEVKLIGGHGFGLAYDVAPVTTDGKTILWNDMAKWRIIGEEGKKLGLKWGGDWKSINDKPHFEYLEGLTYAQLRAGKRPSWWVIKPASRKGIVTANMLNIRSSPDVKAAVLGQLKKDATVEIFETKGDWYRIGSGRWVYSMYVK